jgi:hypothetical protein
MSLSLPPSSSSHLTVVAAKAGDPVFCEGAIMHTAADYEHCDDWMLRFGGA